MQQRILGDGVVNAFAQGQQNSRQQQNFDALQGERTAKAIQDGVRAADTPEKWQVLVGQLSNRYGADAVAPFADFSTRGQALAELEQSLPERQFNALQEQRATSNRNTLASIAQRQSNADRAFELNQRKQTFIESNINPLTNLGKINLDEQRNKITQKQAEGLREKAIGGKTTSIQNKIATLVASGLTLQQAQAVAGGRFSVSVNPTTGNRVLVDKGAREIIPLSQPTQAESPQLQQSNDNLTKNPTLTQATDDATGVINNLQALAAQIPLGIGNALLQNFPGAQDAVRAKQVFKVAQNELIRSFSLNPRFPVAEQNRILSLLPSTGVFSSDQDAKIKLEVLSNNLKSAIDTNMAIARSRAPISERNAALASAAAMQKFIDVIGVGTEIPTVSSVEEARRLPKGTRFKDPQGNVRIR